MRKHIPLSVVLLMAGMIHPAAAQMQEGYSTGKPDVVVDRSVLEELKGYQPPPMFGAPSEEAPIPQKTEPTIKAPEHPTLTAPKAEDLLHHPVKNHHVLTERNMAPMTKPTLTAIPAQALDDLPLPSGNPDNKFQKVKVTSRTISPLTKPPVKKPAVKEIDIAKPPVNKKTADKKDLVKKALSSPQSPAGKEKSFKINAPQTMPAIPPVHVEKDILPPMSGPSSPLPALPPIEPTAAKEAPRPSIGDRIIDASLKSKIEDDRETILQKLGEEKPAKNTTPPKIKAALPEKSKVPADATSAKTSKGKTLVFQPYQTDLTPAMKTTLRDKILPTLLQSKDSRIQILAFATSPDQDENSAKRLSLARALNVRDYLKTSKIDVSRIDVRALASNGMTPGDKVDIVVLGH